MSSKYVPPTLRSQHASSHTNSTMHANVTSGTFTHSLSVSSIHHDAVKQTSLVNTSLPAKDAPKLVPGTLASLTSSGVVSSMQNSFKDMSLEKVSIYKGATKIPNLTDDDFPVLGKKKITIQRAESVPMDFAAKAREWAEKQKEEERIAEKEAKKETMRLQIERTLKEKAERDEKIYKMTLIAIPSKKKTEEWEEDNKRRYSLEDDDDESYETPVEEEEEEEEEEEYNSHWDGRRYRDEY